MNYFEHFGLSLDPFLKNAMQGHQSFLSRDFHNASEILRSGVERNGVVILTAGPGLGKSHAIDRFLSGLDTSRRSGTYVCPPFVSVTEFYRMIAQELGLDPTGNKQRLQCRIKTHIYSVYKRGRPIVLVVDEAQDLKYAVLEELHIFLNFDHDTTDAFTLILSGGPALNEIIDTTEKLASLKQRITNHYDFKGLSDEEIPLYLKHKLEFAGGNNLILDDDALRCLCTASCGISRTIDHIMTDALAYGAQTGRNRIDAEIMQVAIDNQSLVLRKRFSTKASSNRARIA